MKPLYIFDLDGTLCDNLHRYHLIGKDELKSCENCEGKGKVRIAIDPINCPQCEGSGKVPDKSLGMDKWDTFSLGCVEDEPIKAVRSVLYHLVKGGADVRFWTGRGSIARSHTIAWLRSHCSGVITKHEYYFSVDRQNAFYEDWFSSRLTMRPNGDYTPDDKLKLRWYLDLPRADQERIVAVFEDRLRVVEMWRSINVPCFQVAPGAF